MAYKKRKSNKSIIAIGFLAFMVLLLGVYFQPFSVVDLRQDTIYQPEFSRIKCAVIENDHIAQYDMLDRINEDKWATEYCGRGDHEVYTKQCDLALIRGSNSWVNIADIYKCPYDSTFEECTQKQYELTGVAGRLIFSTDEKIVMKPLTSWFGLGKLKQNEIVYQKISNRYGLESISGNNFLVRENSGCNVENIGSKQTIFKTDADAISPNGILLYDQVIQYVSGSYPVVSKNIIQYKGEVVWTIGNSEACRLTQDVNGVRFVNMMDCFRANDLICNPALPYCSDDGTEIINIDSTGGNDGGKTCNQLYGNFVNTFVPNPSNSNEVCQYSCGNDGKLNQDSCKRIPVCGENEMLNTDYVCVTSVVPPIKNDKTDFADPTLIFIILGFVLVILTMVVVKMKQGRNGNGGVSF